jgi:histidine ammonia-lyase
VRSEVPHYDLDRYFAPDIAAITQLVQNGAIAAHSPLSFESEAR